MRVLTGDGVGIGGFIISGNAPKRVILRGIGPSLSQFNVDDVLTDPALELHGPSIATITNDNWRDTQEAEILATGIPPVNDVESAIVATLNPGPYTVILKGTPPNPNGVGLVEIYDLNQGVDSKLANLSTRAFVSTGGNIVIAGFLLSDNVTMDNVIVRGLGPSVPPTSFPNVADPNLELRDSNGVLLLSNNDWQDNPVQAAIIIAAGLAPTDTREAAVAATLPPGLYTALLSGTAGGTGIGLVEVYDLGPPPWP